LSPVAIRSAAFRDRAIPFYFLGNDALVTVRRRWGFRGSLLRIGHATHCVRIAREREPSGRHLTLGF